MSSATIHIRVICKEVLNFSGTICINLGGIMPSAKEQLQEELENFIVKEIMNPIYNGPTDYLIVKEIKGIWRDSSTKTLGIHGNVDDDLLQSICQCGGALDVYVDVGIHIDDGKEDLDASYERERRSFIWWG